MLRRYIYFIIFVQIECFVVIIFAIKQKSDDYLIENSDRTILLSFLSFKKDSKNSAF